jgi:hypothetical protein
MRDDEPNFMGSSSVKLLAMDEAVLVTPPVGRS